MAAHLNLSAHSQSNNWKRDVDQIWAGVEQWKIDLMKAYKAWNLMGREETGEQGPIPSVVGRTTIVFKTTAITQVAPAWIYMGVKKSCPRGVDTVGFWKSRHPCTRIPDEQPFTIPKMALTFPPKNSPATAITNQNLSLDPPWSVPIPFATTCTIRILAWICTCTVGVEREVRAEVEKETRAWMRGSDIEAHPEVEMILMVVTNPIVVEGEEGLKVPTKTMISKLPGCLKGPVNGVNPERGLDLRHANEAPAHRTQQLVVDQGDKANLVSPRVSNLPWTDSINLARSSFSSLTKIHSNHQIIQKAKMP
jgi:hypothetical protein